MAVATEYEVEFKCGHIEDRDLSHKPAGERAGFAKWLAGQDCNACWQRSNHKKDSVEFKKKREAELAEAEEEAQRLNLAVLSGSEKQVPWAMQIRQKMLRESYSDLVESGHMSEAEYDVAIMNTARLIDRAKWWIDNKDCSVEDLPELLADPGLMEAAVTNENVD